MIHPMYNIIYKSSSELSQVRSLINITYSKCLTIIYASNESYHKNLASFRTYDRIFNIKLKFNFPK